MKNWLPLVPRAGVRHREHAGLHRAGRRRSRRRTVARAAGAVAERIAALDHEVAGSRGGTSARRRTACPSRPLPVFGFDPRLLAGREPDEVRDRHRRLVGEQLAVERAHAGLDRRRELSLAADILGVLGEVLGGRRTDLVTARALRRGASLAGSFAGSLATGSAFMSSAGFAAPLAEPMTGLSGGALSSFLLLCSHPTTRVTSSRV